MKKLLFTTVLTGSMICTNVSALETHSEQEIQQKLIGCHTSYKTLREEFDKRFDKSNETSRYLSSMMILFNYVSGQYLPLSEEEKGQAMYDGVITIQDILIEEAPDVTPLLTFCRDEVLSHDKTNMVNKENLK